MTNFDDIRKLKEVDLDQVIFMSEFDGRYYVLLDHHDMFIVFDKRSGNVADYIDYLLYDIPDSRANIIVDQKNKKSCN